MRTDACLSKTMTEIIAAIIGVLLGFALNEFVNHVRRRSEQSQQVKAIRTLIQIEIDQNLNWLSLVSERLGKETEEDRGQKEYLLPRFLARMSIPLWSHRLWESQLPNAALALNQDTLRKVYEFHGDLDRLSEKIYAINENTNQVGYQNELYNQCVELIKKIIERGNPVK